jgi:4-amino-4-deoxy-L-arabinose transferase-like glycosyltransferase
MRPFFVTANEARKLPRLLLLLLCVLYVVPGFLGRDPWRNDDAASFGVVVTMLRGMPQDWWLPNVFGQGFYDEGPFFFWVSALASKALPFLEPHFSMRLTSAVFLGLSLIGIWYATYALAKRPEAQPADPFRLAASPTDFARAVADISILVMMSCFGIILRAHETTSEVLQLSLMALFLWGCGLGLSSPRLGGLLAGLSIGATTITEGPVLALALLTTAGLLPLFLRQYRLETSRFFIPLVVAAAVLGLAWPSALLFGNNADQTHLAMWLASAFPGWIDPKQMVISFVWTLRSVPWYLWPLWPIALWTLIRWRGQWDQPIIVLPGLTATIAAIAFLITGQASEAQMMALVPPLAVLAALGLPTLAKSVTNLLDWLAVVIFSTFGLIIWVYFIAGVSGWPVKMANSSKRFAAGYPLQIDGPELVMAILATAIWVAVVVWRFSSVQKPIWRTIVLSGSGLALVWFLLMSLWLPVFNHRKTYRDVSQEISAIIPKQTQCINSTGLSLSQRAILGYFLAIPFAEQPASASAKNSAAQSPDSEANQASKKLIRRQCDWLLVADRANKPITAPDPKQWQLRWEGKRVADRQERVRVYRLYLPETMTAFKSAP